MRNAVKKMDFNLALGNCLSKMSDGSFKVGVQGLDANRWRITEILPVLASYADFAEVVKKETGADVPPVDVWGGGQVSQPPRFLGEDPFDNLSKMKEAAPNLKLKCIYRGRQGFGFLPCSDEVQRLAIIESASRGMQVFRMFDAMHDAVNLMVGIKAVSDFREAQVRRGTPERDLVWAEGLVFYAAPPRDTGSVWALKDTLDYAVRLADLGFLEISIADYAEQIVAEEGIVNLVEAIRSRLDNRGYDAIVVNFFAQGNRVEILKAALGAGAGSVDVAIGALSGQFSNANTRDLLHLMMLDGGFDIDCPLYKNHPVLQALTSVEVLIERAARKHQPYRSAASGISKETLFESRLAYNAVSALNSAIDKAWETQIEPNLQETFLATSSSPKQAYLSNVLSACRELWIAGGQFHAVSPFGYFCSFQAEQITRSRLSTGTELPLNFYRDDYQNIIKGRYGRNLGVVRGHSDPALSRTFHILEALNYLRVKIDVLGVATVQSILSALELSDHIFADPLQASTNKINIRLIPFNDRVGDVIKGVDFGKLVSGISALDLDEVHQDRLIFAVSHKPFPLPTDTLADGLRVVDRLIREEGLNALDIQASKGRLTLRETAGLSALLFKVEGPDPFCIWKNLYRFLNNPSRRTYGDIEPDTRPFDKLLQREIAAMADVKAKQRILSNLGVPALWNPNSNTKNGEALTLLDKKIAYVMVRVYERLHNEGYAYSNADFLSLEDAVASFHILSDTETERVLRHLKLIHPSQWEEHSYFDALAGSLTSVEDTEHKTLKPL